MKLPDKTGLEYFRTKANDFITKEWFSLHIIFISCYILYIIIKILVGGKILSNSEEQIHSFNLFWFILSTIGFGILAFIFISDKAIKLWKFLIIVVFGFSLITFSYCKTSDPDLKWDGKDVATGNYISAIEENKYGALDLINTWNDRTNPYDSNSAYSNVNTPTREFIDRHNLSGLTFDKWKKVLDSSKYELKLNNRPFVHSPFPTLIMGWWLKLFPFGRRSLQIQMLFLVLLSIILVIFFANKKKSGSFSKIVFISILTSPVMFKYQDPATDQLSMFLFTLPIFLYLLYPSRKFIPSLIYGLIFGFCLYTKFTVFIFLFILALTLFFYHKKITFIPLLGLVLGLILPVILFTSLGYYLWLTIITGPIITKLYSVNQQIYSLSYFIKSMSKFLYFGPSVLLLSIFLVINMDKLCKTAIPYFIPTVISLIFLIFYLYDQNASNRYLSQYLPALALFLLMSSKTIDLKKKDLFISVFINYLFLNLNIYF